MSDVVRSRRARDLAEQALVRLVRAYGDIPKFVLLGGLVPDLLCRRAPHAHEGTTDVDVQVNLEIQSGAENAARLEETLLRSGFTPDRQEIWRWRDETDHGLVVKVEFLSDLRDVEERSTITFDNCNSLGAVNLRGTGFASRDWMLLPFSATVDDEDVTVQVRVATLGAYLLAKVHAAHGRNLPKDWYDIAYVLLHNDEGGPKQAGRLTVDRFGDDIVGATSTALGELAANFTDADAQGSRAYASTMFSLHPDLDRDTLANDAVEAVRIYVAALQAAERS